MYFGVINVTKKVPAQNNLQKTCQISYTETFSFICLKIGIVFYPNSVLTELLIKRKTELTLFSQCRSVKFKMEIKFPITQKKTSRKSRSLHRSERGIRTLDTMGMNHVL